MATWIMNEDGSYLNSEMIEYIYIEDRGEDCPNRYRLMAVNSTNDYEVLSSADKKVCQDKLNELMDPYGLTEDQLDSL